MTRIFLEARLASGGFFQCFHAVTGLSEGFISCPGGAGQAGLLAPTSAGLGFVSRVFTRSRLTGSLAGQGFPGIRLRRLFFFATLKKETAHARLLASKVQRTFSADALRPWWFQDARGVQVWSCGETHIFKIAADSCSIRLAMPVKRQRTTPFESSLQVLGVLHSLMLF